MQPITCLTKMKRDFLDETLELSIDNRNQARKYR